MGYVKDKVIVVVVNKETDVLITVRKMRDNEKLLFFERYKNAN